jgi:hypothetical protein
VVDQRVATSLIATLVIGVYNQNPFHPLDVDQDFVVSPLDVLQTVNSLNEQNSRRIAPGQGVAPFYDVNADGSISPLDALMIINYLNAHSDGNGALGEGESLLKSVEASTANPNTSNIVSMAYWPEITRTNSVDQIATSSVEIRKTRRQFEWTSRSPDRSQDGLSMLAASIFAASTHEDSNFAVSNFTDLVEADSIEVDLGWIATDSYFSRYQNK